MKEIKAYVTKHRIADVLEALANSGLCDGGAGAPCHVAVSGVQRPFAEDNPADQRYSTELAEPIASEYRLELLCADEHVDRLVDLIAEGAHTGRSGAGLVSVSEVAMWRVIH